MMLPPVKPAVKTALLPFDHDSPNQFGRRARLIAGRAGNVDNVRMDSVIQEKVLAVARAARSRDESLAWFRVALGLYYLAGLMTPDTIDFKQVDREYNRFIYQSIGKGHSIASVLQFMSGEKVVAVVDSQRFIGVFAEHCPEVPVDTIGFLLSLNLWRGQVDLQARYRRHAAGLDRAPGRPRARAPGRRRAGRRPGRAGHPIMALSLLFSHMPWPPILPCIPSTT